MIEIHTVGGYNEVGKNCTAINIEGDVILCDVGLHLENYIRCTESEEEDLIKLSSKYLSDAGAVPDTKPILHLKKQVKAIIPTHAHLDHIGAIPYLGNKFDAEILGTPFTNAVLNTILKDEKIYIKNPIRTLSENANYHLTKNKK